MKKIRNSFAIVLIAAFMILAACGREGASISESSATSAKTTSQESVDDVSSEPKEQNFTKYDRYEPKTFDSISEMIHLCDTYFSQQLTDQEDKDIYDKALAAYDREIGTVTAECICEMNTVGSVDRLRYSFGYIDYDTVPEVFVCCSDTGVCGVHIFTYDYREDKVIWVGEYGTRGVLRYAEGKGRMIAQYGNNGFFTDNFIEVSPFRDSQIIGRTAWYYSEGGEICYARLPFPEGSDGSNNSPRISHAGGIPNEKRDDYSADNTKYVVGGDEYKSIRIVLLNFAPEESVKRVELDEMDIVLLGEGGMELKPGKSADY